MTERILLNSYITKEDDLVDTVNCYKVDDIHIVEITSRDSLDQIYEDFHKTKSKVKHGELSRRYEKKAEALNQYFGRRVYNKTIC